MKQSDLKFFSHFFGSSNFFRFTFFVCFIASMIPLWSVKYPPMVDTPQHAVQVSILRHYEDLEFGFKSQFKLHWFTPYALAYLVTWFFSLFFNVLVSIKISISLAVLGLALSTRFLLRQIDGDPWWSLVAFPIAFGYGFIWGLFNYIFALPIGITAIAFAFDFSLRPSVKVMGLYLFWMLLAFFSHGIVFGITYIISISVIFFFSSPLVPWKHRMMPIFTVTPIVFIWYFSSSSGAPGFDSMLEWARPGFRRFGEMRELLLSVHGDWLGERYASYLLIAILLSIGRIRSKIKYFIPFGLAVGFFCFGPHHMLGHSLIYARLTPFIFIGFLIFLGKSSPTKKRVYISHALIVLIIFSWMRILRQRFVGFNEDAKPFDSIVNHMESNKSLLGLTYDRYSLFMPGEVFYHFPAWYQVEKGGKLGYSIAYLYNVVAKYKPGRELLPLSKTGPIWTDPRFMNWDDYGVYDYYIVRSFKREHLKSFEKFKDKVELKYHEGPWWLYARKKTKDKS